jgi:subtilase family serine protease
MFAQAAAQGQSVFVGSGDWGVDDTLIGTPNVSEMSADPNVTSVGGTEFTANYDASGNDIGFVAESVWNNGVAPAPAR